VLSEEKNKRRKKIEDTSKMGRPRKYNQYMPLDNLREQWKKGSRKYYYKNREKILEKARRKFRENKLLEEKKQSSGSDVE